MKKIVLKTFCILALLTGIVIGATGHGILAFIGGVMISYCGALGLLGKKRIIYR